MHNALVIILCWLSNLQMNFTSFHVLITLILLAIVNYIKYISLRHNYKDRFIDKHSQNEALSIVLIHQKDINRPCTLQWSLWCRFWFWVLLYYSEFLTQYCILCIIPQKNCHQSCTWGMTCTKIHLISPGCSKSSIVLSTELCHSFTPQLSPTALYEE